MDNFIEKICDDIFKTQDFNHFNNKTILITGGTGSFGKAAVKFLLAKCKLKKLIILS